MGRPGMGRPGSVAAVVASLAVLGACSPTSDAAPPSSSGPGAAMATSSAPATSSTSSNPTDDEQAVAAAQRYVESTSRALDSGTTTELRAQFVDGCIVCARDADHIDSLHAAGRHVQGGHVSLSSIRVESAPDPTHRMLTCVISAAAAIVVDVNGRQVDSFPASSSPKRILVAKSGATWLVEGVFT